MPPESQGWVVARMTEVGGVTSPTTGRLPKLALESWGFAEGREQEVLLRQSLEESIPRQNQEAGACGRCPAPPPGISQLSCFGGRAFLHVPKEARRGVGRSELITR